jgi:hypothetical protein
MKIKERTSQDHFNFPQVHHGTFLNPKRRSSFLNEKYAKERKEFSNPIKFWAIIPKFLYSSK